MIRAVLFDFDGVLTIDKTGSYTICKYISSVMKIDFDVFSRSYRKYNDRLLTGEISHDQIWEELCSSVGVEIPKRVLIDSFRSTSIDERMIELIRSIKKNEYDIALVTENKKDRIDEILQYTGIGRYFDAVSISSEIGSGKEDTRIFEVTRRKLNIENEECVFIDNREKNLIVPRMMGMRTVHYDDEEKNVRKLEQELEELGIRTGKM